MTTTDLANVPLLDLASATITAPDAAVASRTVGEVPGLFADEAARQQLDPTTLLYRVWTVPGSTATGELLVSTTVIEPGKVGDEFFMTRGHFHTGRNRGEFTLTLAGEGRMVLMDDDRHARVERMTPGSLHVIAGAHAHRAVNVGREPLRFLVVWPADTGHDYEAIARAGFSVRIREIDGHPTAVPV